MLRLVPSGEVVVCGETREKGGSYEWTCTVQGKHPVHVFEAFPKSREENVH